MLQRIWAITQKEFVTTFRDRGTLFLVLFMPLIQLVLFAYAIHMDVRGIPMAVADQSLGVFWFGVAFKGSLASYLWLTLPFIMSCLGLGFLISTVAKNQRQAQQMSTVVMLFSMLLTGLVYPRNVMPWIPQLIGSFLPLTYFIRISQ